MKKPKTLLISLLNVGGLAMFIFDPILDLGVTTSSSLSISLLAINNICNITIYFCYYLI